MQDAPFSRILVGVDASDQTPGVLQRARRLSDAIGAEVIVCTVANIPTSVEGNEQDGYPASKEEQAVIDKLEEIVQHEYDSDSDKKIEVKILHGDPAERISEYAEYSNCDLVIVGSRGLGGLRKALVGSVSSSVASRCKGSVRIVR